MKVERVKKLEVYMHKLVFTRIYYVIHCHTHSYIQMWMQEYRSFKPWCCTKDIKSPSAELSYQDSFSFDRETIFAGEENAD